MLVSSAQAMVRKGEAGRPANSGALEYLSSCFTERRDKASIADDVIFDEKGCKSEVL